MFKNKIFWCGLYLCSLLLLLPYNISFAVPAIPFQIEMKQPDGNNFQGYLRGDEWFNWRETTDGRVIIQNPDTGFFEFALIQKLATGDQLIPSGIVVAPLPTDTANKQALALPAITHEDLIRLRVDAIQNMKGQ